MNRTSPSRASPHDRPGGWRLVAAFAVAILAMTGAGVWFYHSQRQSLRQETEANLETIARLKVDQVVQWRNERLANASMLMGNTFLKEAIAKWMETPDPVATESLLAFFRAESQYHPYQEVSLVDSSGQVRLSLGGNPDPLHEETIQAVAVALRDRRPVLSDLHAGPGDQPPHLDVIAPLFVKSNGTARAIGAICLRSNAHQWLYPLIKSWPVHSSSAETMLVRRDGDAVLYLNEVRNQQDTALKLRLPLSRTDLPAARVVLGGKGFFYGKDYRGVPVVAVLKAIPDSPWFMVAKVDVAEAFAVRRFRSVLILALIFGCVIATTAVAGLLWQRKTKFQRYTRSLIEASLDPLVTISPSGKITDVNTSTETATGRTRTELIGTDFSDYFTEPEKARAGYEQVFREGSVRDYPLELRHRDGSVTSVLYNATVYRNESGEVVGVFAAARDITERKRTEEALRRLNRELQAISNCNQILMRAVDEQTLLKDLCRIVCDEAGYRMAWVGYAENDDARTVRPAAWAGSEEGYLANVNITWADTERGRGPTGTAIRTGETIRIESITTDPQVAPWRESALQRGYQSSIALPLKDQNAKTFGALSIYSSEPNAFTPEEIRLLEELAGDLAFGIAVLRARAERKRAEEEIQNLNQELEKRVAERTSQLELANKELESFAYSVSHDLRAPLRTIDGFSRIIQEDYADKLDGEGKGNLATIRAASQHMAQLIDDILQLSRLTRTPLRLLPVDLSELAASVADGLKKVEPEREVEFVIEPGCVAFADGNLMRIVLENLFGNAWKFTGKQSAAKIEFGRATHGGVPAYFVRDNGVGFDMQYATKLFSAFQRLHTVDEFPGTGIGLATVQRVIHRHGGKVWIEGRVNEGATAYFTIPQPEGTI